MLRKTLLISALLLAAFALAVQPSTAAAGAPAAAPASTGGSFFSSFFSSISAILNSVWQIFSPPPPPPPAPPATGTPTSGTGTSGNPTSGTPASGTGTSGSKTSPPSACPNLPTAANEYKTFRDSQQQPAAGAQHQRSRHVARPAKALFNATARRTTGSSTLLSTVEQIFLNTWHQGMSGSTVTGNLANSGASASCSSQLPAQSITPDFQHWLDANDYKQYEFKDNGCGKANSFGGRQAAGEQVIKRPIVFVHGDGDSAVGTWTNLPASLRLCGWAPQIQYFMSPAGGDYKMSELYALTWGPNDVLDLLEETHNQVYLTRIHKFIEAILKYTGASKIDVISHSMGVTLARGAILGADGAGANLSGHVANFIGIAGGNHGLSLCEPIVPICNAVNGFDLHSKYLTTINNAGKVADNIFSIWSNGDTLMRCQSVTPNTCLVPGQKCDVELHGVSHTDARDDTSALQMKLLTTGQCN